MGKIILANTSSKTHSPLNPAIATRGPGDYDYQLNLVIHGDSGTGKSSLLLRYADNTYTGDFISTIGVDFKNRTFKSDYICVKTQVWDTCGQGNFINIRSGYYNKFHGIIIVFDTTDRTSFNNVKRWVDDVIRHYGSLPIVLVASKIDEIGRRVVETDEAIKLAKDLEAEKQVEISYVETSAKTGENVDIAFFTLADQCLQQMQRPLSNNAHTESSVTRRQLLIDRLDRYITRIDSYQKSSSNSIDFNHGFWFKKDSRALNRQANYYLAKSLKSQLESRQLRIDDIFDVDNIVRLRQQAIVEHQLGLMPFFKNRGIKSRELSNIIKKSQNEIKLSKKSARSERRPLLT